MKSTMRQALAEASDDLRHARVLMQGVNGGSLVVNEAVYSHWGFVSKQYFYGLFLVCAPRLRLETRSR